jgi:predicted nucleotidyltransferase
VAGQRQPLLEELLSAVASALGPLSQVRAAWVFGSRARGDARPDSDLDVGVVYQRDLGPLDRELARREILQRLTDALGLLGEGADVVDLDRAGSSIAFQCLREGRLALERDADERAWWMVRAFRAYQDDAKYRALWKEAAYGPAREGDPDA